MIMAYTRNDLARSAIGVTVDAIIIWIAEYIIEME